MYGELYTIPSFFLFTHLRFVIVKLSIEATCLPRSINTGYYSNLLDQWTFHKQTNRFHSGPSLSVFSSYFYRMCRRSNSLRQWIIDSVANIYIYRKKEKKSSTLPFVQFYADKYMIPIFHLSFRKFNVLPAEISLSRSMEDKGAISRWPEEFWKEERRFDIKHRQIRTDAILIRRSNQLRWNFRSTQLRSVQTSNRKFISSWWTEK